MLTRIFVILAIIAGLAVIVLTQFTIRPHFQEIIETRDQYGRNWTNELNRANKLQKNLRATEEKLVATEGELKSTQTKLAAQTSRADNLERQAKGLQNDLTKTQAELHTTQQKLAAWDALGLAVEEVKAVIVRAKNLETLNQVLEDEKMVLIRVNQRLTNQIAELIGTREYEPPLPPDTRGHVLVVDPKWKFVVLDIGENKEMVPNGVLLVSREGKLIAKIKIVTVYSNRCIANVMPGWDFGDVMEGDLVISKR
jgi:Skp family chaperone for outer membrane proteins